MIGRPENTSRLVALMEGVFSGSVLRCRKSAVRVETSATLIRFGLAWWVRLIQGVKLAEPPLLVMVVLGVFVPHQLSVTVIVPCRLKRLPPPGVRVEVLPASRLKLMVIGTPAPVSPVKMPPPLPVVLLPVMVTLLSVRALEASL